MGKDYEIEFYKSEIKRLELELEMEKNNKQLPSDMMNQVNEVVELASTMRKILEEVRYEQISMNLAKKIDYALKQAREFD
jgi:hypothetical protein